MFKFNLIILLFLLFSALAVANEEELLPPEQAFVLSTQLSESNQIDLRWDIAEGYYLYKQKLKLDLNGQVIDYSQLELPEGIPIEDPLFGLVNIYKNQLAFSIANRQTNPAVNLTVSYQGCYEPLGICYPPQTESFNLISQAQASDSPAKTGIFSQGNVFTINPDEEFLPVDEAFQLVITNTDTNRVVANFEAAEGYYLYKPHIKFNSENPQIILSEINYPEGIVKDDPHFGEIEVYYGNATIPINLARLAKTNDLSLVAEYQGCAEDGICYQPQTRKIEMTLADFDGPFADAGVNNQDVSNDKSLFWYLLAAFGGGLLLTFTPCVLPMIPILSGIIMAERGKGGLHHSGLLSVIYVLGTAVSYSLIGAVAGASGEQLQAYFQTPWAIGFLSVLLLLMSLSMFGFFKLQVPAFMQTSLSGHSQKLASGGAISVFAMGLISALIVGACVSPLLISTLSIAIAKGSALLGAALMFSMAMGMGVVLIFFGFEFGHLVPKAGTWMEDINKIIGFLLLAVAIYLLSFIPAIPVLFLWSLLLVSMAIFLFSKQFNKGFTIIAKTAAVLSLVWGVLAFIGGLNGYRDIMNPLPIKQLVAGSSTQTQLKTDLFTIVTSNSEIDELFAQARTENKFVMLDYYADWCLDCLRMEGSTFKDPGIANLLNEKFINVKVDVTDASDEAVKSVKKRFNVFGPPATLFFSADGNEFADLKFYGYRDSEEFMQILKRVTG